MTDLLDFMTRPAPFVKGSDTSMAAANARGKRPPVLTGLSVKRLKELYTYDPETGVFRRRLKVGRFLAGSIAGSSNRGEYITITIDYRGYFAHRLAWLYVHGRWPQEQIDHINGDPSDNRLSNLREASPRENSRNKSAQKNNKSGLKGVCFIPRLRMWRAAIHANGKNEWLGHFRSPNEAHEAYQAAARRLFGDFARAS